MIRVTQLPALPSRPMDGHKGLFGRVLVVGGSEGMLGVPVLAGTAALRMGGGLVQLAVSKAILGHCLSITPELIGLPLGRGVPRELLSTSEQADAIVLGPGLGRSPEAQQRVAALVRRVKPMVIDADALNILSQLKRWPKYFRAQAVLTPHPKEMSRLGGLFGRKEVVEGDDERIELGAAAADAFGQVIVLKGARTVVTDGRRVYLNATGNSALSKAGSGDVLCGVLGTLLAQQMDRFDAACAAVWVHGRAGELAGRQLGLRSVLAREVIDSLPAAIADYGRQSS